MYYVMAIFSGQSKTQQTPTQLIENDIISNALAFKHVCAQLIDIAENLAQVSGIDRSKIKIMLLCPENFWSQSDLPIGPPLPYFAYQMIMKHIIEISRLWPTITFIPGTIKYERSHEVNEANLKDDEKKLEGILKDTTQISQMLRLGCNTSDHRKINELNHLFMELRNKFLELPLDEFGAISLQDLFSKASPHFTQIQERRIRHNQAACVPPGYPTLPRFELDDESMNKMADALNTKSGAFLDPDPWTVRNSVKVVHGGVVKWNSTKCLGFNEMEALNLISQRYLHGYTPKHQGPWHTSHHSYNDGDGENGVEVCVDHDARVLQRSLGGRQKLKSHIILSDDVLNKEAHMCADLVVHASTYPYSTGVKLKREHGKNKFLHISSIRFDTLALHQADPRKKSHPIPGALPQNTLNQCYDVIFARVCTDLKPGFPEPACQYDGSRKSLVGTQGDWNRMPADSHGDHTFGLLSF